MTPWPILSRRSAWLAPVPLLLLACRAAPEGTTSLARDGERWRAAFPLSGARVDLDATGLHLAGRGVDPGWSLRLDAWGRSAGLVPLAPATPEAGPEGRVEAHRDGLTEWWTLGGAGGEAIEHGWTVDHAPAGAGPLRFALRATGAVGRVEGGAVAWNDAAGRRWSYTQLSVVDAAGVALPARFVDDGGAVYVEVDDAGARWPITVDPLLSTAEATVNGETAYAGFAYTMADAGDYNGDGFDETIVSAYHYQGYNGRVYFNWGGPGGFDWNRPDLLDPDADSSTEPFFATVAALGDVNADGLDDFAVGGSGYNQSTGRVWVFLGENAVPTTAHASTIDGESTFGNFGNTLVGLGDVNGDGYADMAVGAYGYTSYTGRVYVYYGSADGLVTPAAQTFDGPAINSSFGRTVAAAGDLNADGYADLLVGAPGDAKALGQVYVYLGSAAGLVAGPTRTGAETTESFGSALTGVGDLDGDGYGDMVVGSPADLAYAGRFFVYRGGPDGLDLEPPVAVEGDKYGTTLGTAIAAVGDIDGDGYTEVLVGAPGTDGYRGEALLYTGRATGFDTDPITRLEGEVAGDYFGATMAPLGDVDGDGFRDAMVGAPRAESLTGRAYVYLGYPPSDDDADGYDETLDCDDTNAAVHPDAEEVIADGIDEDCDGGELCYVDADGDLYRPDGTGTVASEDGDCADPGEADLNVPTGDCDDTDPKVHPGASEVAADGIDQDCDGEDPDTDEPTGKTTKVNAEGCGCTMADPPGEIWLAGLGGVALVMLRRRPARVAAPPVAILR